MNPGITFPKLILLIPCLLLAVSSWAEPSLPTSYESAVTFTVRLNDGTLVTAGSTDIVALQSNQSVLVVAQYPLACVGHRITAVPLDGGRVLGAAKQLVVDQNATIQFQFEAGGGAGLYQVSLRDRAQELAVNFWVLDSEAPSNNPIVVNQ